MSEAEGDAINQTANPPISEVVVLARSTDAYEGETIVSNDDVSVAQSQSQNYNNNSSTLSGRISQATVWSNASTGSRIQHPSLSTREIMTKLEKMSEADKQVAMEMNLMARRSYETKAAVNTVRKEVKEYHQATMAGQEEILSRGNSNHNATLSAIETAKNETVHAVIEHLEKTLTPFRERGFRASNEDFSISASTPARGTARTPAGGRTPMTASRSTPRSEKRSRPPSSAAMSSRKSASIRGFDGHVERMRRGEEDL